MTQEKFQSETKTLEHFFTRYCNDKHQNQYKSLYFFNYKGIKNEIQIHLCKECHELLSYSYDKLVHCPHEIKPRCRQCPNPCYEKPQWKALAKLMQYSGMQLGLLKIKRFFTRSS